MLEVCRDKHSRGFYRLVAQTLPEELIRTALSETKYQDRIGRLQIAVRALPINSGDLRESVELIRV
jgi:hypothetical protein